MFNVQYNSYRKDWPLFILLCFLLLSFLNFADYAIRLIIYSYEWEPYESHHVYQAWRFINGGQLYKNISVYPMYVLSYTPLFFVFCGSLMKITGLCFWPGRLLSTISALFISFIIYSAIRKDKQPPFWALVGALLFFISPSCASYFLPMVRVDALMLAFSLAGLYFMQGAPTSILHCVLGGIFLLCAFYTKQSAILFAAAGWLWLFTVNRRRALIVGGIWVLALISIFFLINHTSNGEFYHHTVGLIIAWHQPGLMLGLFKHFLLNWGIFFAGAIAGLSAIIYRRENTIWAYFFIFSLINIPMTNRTGAVPIYYIPIIASMALICGREAGRLYMFLTMAKRHLIGKIGFIVIIIFGILAANRFQYMRPNLHDVHIMNSYCRKFGNVSGDIILSQMQSLAFLNDKPIFIFPIPLGCTCNFNYNGVDQSTILADITHQRFDHILDTCHGTFFSDQIIDAINSYYQPAGKLMMPNYKGGEEFVLLSPRELTGDADKKNLNNGFSGDTIHNNE